MSEKKQNILIVLGIFVLISMVGGLTFAFFNYTRTGDANTLKLGDIEFNFTQGNSINLTNAFPVTITRDGNGLITNVDDDNIDTVEVVITGKNTYSEGVEYLVSSTNSVTTITSNGKPVQVPISLDVQVGTNGNGSNDNLGTSDVNYFKNRDTYTTSHYKKLIGDTLVGDQMMVVGFIAPNTTNTDNSVNGKITIKAYFDNSKIAITDTPDENSTWQQGRTVMSTSEWNSLNSSGVSFQIKVEAQEGIWVTGSLEEIMRSESLGVDTTQGVDFSKTSDGDNTKGVYLRNGTQSDTYPVVYYRGAVENNNVMFADKCWKAVRTTDTGGVKLVYNGELLANKAPLAESDYTISTNTASLEFNSTTNTYTKEITGTDGSGSSQLEISFTVPAGDGYILEVYGTTSTSGQVSLSISYPGGDNGTGNGGGGSFALTQVIGTLTSSGVVKVSYYGNGTSESPSIMNVRMLKQDVALGMGCDNAGTASQITLNGTNTFAFSGTNLNKSPAYNGYMWGTVYEYKTGSKSGTYWSDVQYNGSVYELKTGGTTNGSLNPTHHYVCENSANCTKVRYYYYTKYYIELENGKTVEDALREMQTNTNPSNAKTQIDAWYASNMTSYTGKLEDTVYCNDRSMGSGNNNGWIANGGDLSTYLNYGAYQRSGYSTNNATKNQPSLGCVNKNDRFTVSNQEGNQKLQYPVALLTEDEMVLAGGLAGSSSGFYLNTGAYYWSLSPSYFNTVNARGFDVDRNGKLLDNGYFVGSPFGLRPAVSLKPGTPVISGDGTSTSPYLIR